MKTMLLIAFSCVAFSASAQQSDLFILKKQNGKPVRRYYKGSYINFITKDNDRYSGYIKKVANDSVWVQYQQVLTGMTVIGGSISDTITYEARKFAVNDISYVDKEKRGFEEAVPGVLLKIGGAGYILLHTVNGVIQKEKIELGKIGIAAGAYLAGVLLNKLRKNYYYIGKRYHLQYISLLANRTE